MAKARKPKSSRSRPLRRQVGALPFRINRSGAIEILIITSRETGRFIIPKGWAKKRLHDTDTAAIEAFEEAGVYGEVYCWLVGSFTYWKRHTDRSEKVEVAVYPIKVTQQLDDWPEKHQRETAWHPTGQAAALVSEPELADLILQFDGTP